MGDLKTPYDDPAMSPPDPGGVGIISRGGDPLIDVSGSSGLEPAWGNPPVSNPDGKETTNSVSGLPGIPSRWEPSEQSEQPPSMEDRSPGTIDRR